METKKAANVDDIIKKHVWFATIPGFLPLPILDIVGIAYVQVDMVKQMCKFYDVPYDENKGKAVVTALASSILTRIQGYAIRSVLKNIPIFGWLLGGLSLSAFAGASTYATGMVFKRHFENGGTIGSIDPEDVKEFYKEQFEKGKEFVQNLTNTDSSKKEDKPEEPTADQEEKPEE